MYLSRTPLSYRRTLSDEGTLLTSEGVDVVRSCESATFPAQKVYATMVDLMQKTTAAKAEMQGLVLELTTMFMSRLEQLSVLIRENASLVKCTQKIQQINIENGTQLLLLNLSERAKSPTKSRKGWTLVDA